MEVVVTTGAIGGAKLQSNRHHQQTNTQLFSFYMPDTLVSPNQQCQSTEIVIKISITLRKGQHESTTTSFLQSSA